VIKRGRATHKAKSTTEPERPEPTDAEAVGAAMSPAAAPIGGAVEDALTVRATVAATPFTYTATTAEANWGQLEATAPTLGLMVAATCAHVPRGTRPSATAETSSVPPGHTTAPASDSAAGTDSASTGPPMKHVAAQPSMRLTDAPEAESCSAATLALGVKAAR